MTNLLDNWEKEFEKCFSNFPTSAWWHSPVKLFISTLLQEQREKEQQRILELIVTNYTQSGHGDLIPVSWESFKKEIFNQSNKSHKHKVTILSNGAVTCDSCIAEIFQAAFKPTFTTKDDMNNNQLKADQEL